MVRLSSFPDLSRFVKREDKVKVNNTVHLLVGEDSIEVSGLVLSQASQVLQDLVGNQRELYLDQFSGEIEGIQDVVEMLYGGEIELSEVNYQTIIKFSTVFQVKEMYQLCIEWVKVNILTLDLFSLINFGLLIEQVGQDNPDVLELCVGFIRDDVGDGLSEISKSWVIGSNTNFVKFLVHKDIFYFTLPILSEWITAYSSDTSVNLILTELEDKDLVEFFWKYGDRSTDLLKRLNENVEAITTSKRLTGFNIVNHKNCMMVGVDKSKLLCPEVCFVSKDTVPGLISEAYTLFSFNKVLGL